MCQTWRWVRENCWRHRIRPAKLGLTSAKGRGTVCGSSREGRKPQEIAAALGKQGISVWTGKTYVLAVAERLGLEGKGGMVRL